MMPRLIGAIIWRMRGYVKSRKAQLHRYRLLVQVADFWFKPDFWCKAEPDQYRIYPSSVSDRGLL